MQYRALSTCTYAAFHEYNRINRAWFSRNGRQHGRLNFNPACPRQALQGSGRFWCGSIQERDKTGTYRVLLITSLAGSLCVGEGEVVAPHRLMIRSQGGVHRSRCLPIIHPKLNAHLAELGECALQRALPPDLYHVFA